MLLRGSDKHQQRVLTITGAAVLLSIVIAVILAVSKPFGGRPSDRISVVIDTPYVGQGVQSGTAVVLHGVQVGHVTNVNNLPGGGVRLVTDLQKRPVAGVTDSMDIDFRPINYFGVPGINVIPGSGGEQLRDGTKLQVLPKGNFTLPELLTQLGEVSASAITPRLVSVIDRATRYTDALNPLFETILTVTTTVADVQRVPTAQLLANTAAVSTGVPPIADAGLDAGTRFIDNNLPQGPATTNPDATTNTFKPPFLEGVQLPSYRDEAEETWQNGYKKSFDIAANDLFAGVGKLESSHVDDLLSLVNSVQALTDIAPPLIRADNFGQAMTELRVRFEKLYAGNSQQRALQVRIILDSIPAVAAPLGLTVDSGQ